MRAEAIYGNLPKEFRARTRGKEVYISTPVEAGLEAGAGGDELAFRQEGGAIATGFGPTPIPRGGEIRLAARTYIGTRALDDVRTFERVRPGDPVRVQIAE